MKITIGGSKMEPVRRGNADRAGLRKLVLNIRSLGFYSEKASAFRIRSLVQNGRARVITLTELSNDANETDARSDVT